MADETKLTALHDKVAEVLIDALDPVEVPQIEDEEGNVIQEATRMPVSAAHITAAIQFLKNNSITCAPAEDNKLGELKRKMEERQARRANKGQANVVDLEAARETASYLDRKVGNLP